LNFQPILGIEPLRFWADGGTSVINALENRRTDDSEAVMNKKSWSAGLIIPLAAGMAVAAAPSGASAAVPRAQNAATARAVCSDARSQIVLNARVNANERIVLTLRVTTQRPRPQWDVTINRVNRANGVNRPIFQSREFAVRQGVAQQRSFQVVTRTANQPGADRFVARAVHVASGEVCRVAITVRANNRAPEDPFEPVDPFEPED
jgi:hypothetical protein